MMPIGKKRRLIKKESIINRFIFPFKFNGLRIDPKKSVHRNLLLLSDYLALKHVAQQQNKNEQCRTIDVLEK